MTCICYLVLLSDLYRYRCIMSHSYTIKRYFVIVFRSLIFPFLCSFWAIIFTFSHTHILYCCQYIFPTNHYWGGKTACCWCSHHINISVLPTPFFCSAHIAVHMQNHATHIHMLYLSPYIVTDWFCGTLSPFYFVIKRDEQTLRPGLCLSDSPMTIVHILTVGISLLDPYCLPRVQYCCYQFSCIVSDWVCGTMFSIVITSLVVCCWCKSKLLCYA